MDLDELQFADRPADLNDVQIPGSSPSYMGSPSHMELPPEIAAELQLDEDELMALEDELMEKDDEQHAALAKKIREQAQTPWSITEQDVALLLQHEKKYDLPRCPYANRLHPTQCRVFIVEPEVCGTGKRARETEGCEDGLGLGERTHAKANFGSVSSAKVTDLGDGSHLAVLKVGGSNQDKLNLEFNKYCLVLRPGHREYDQPFPNGTTPRPTKEAGRAKTKFQHRVPDKDIRWLVHSTPKGTAAPTATRPDQFPGDVNICGTLTVNKDLEVRHGTIRGRIEGPQADHAEYWPRFDADFEVQDELNDGDVVALVSNEQGVQTVSRSARGSDRAEWSVVSTDPQILGNRKHGEDEEHKFAKIVLSGQVHVRMKVKPPADAYLVPSGLEDGCARVLTDEERPLNVLGQVVNNRVENGRVMARVQKGMGTEPMNRYILRELDRMRGENERVHEEKQGAMSSSAAPPPAAPEPAPSLLRSELRAAVDVDPVQGAEQDVARVDDLLQALSVAPQGSDAVALADAAVAHVPHACHGPRDAEHERNSSRPAWAGPSDAESLKDVRIEAVAHKGRLTRQAFLIGNPFCHKCRVMPIVGKYYQRAGSSFRQDVCEACFGHLSEAEQLEYEEAMPPPATGEWPWDEVGKLDCDGRKLVTPARAVLNRLSLLFKVINRGVCSGGLGVAAVPVATYTSTASAKILASNEEEIRATGHGDSAAEAEACAELRLLEANDCQLLELHRKLSSGEYVAEIGQAGYHEARPAAGSGGGGAEATVGPHPAASPVEQAAMARPVTSGKSRLNAMAHRLLAGQMSALQDQRLVLYTPLLPADGGAAGGSSEGGGARFRCRATLVLCEGRPSFTGAAAQSIKASEHSAAERALAFVDCVVRSLSDPSYTFGFSKLSLLLADLREMHAASAALETSASHDTGTRSSFKELLHNIAMRIRRPCLGDAVAENDASLRSGRSQPNWSEPRRFLRYEAVQTDEGEELGRSEHGTPLERVAVTFVQFDGEPTFVGAPAAGRRAAEQAAAEAALAFVFDRTLAEPLRMA